MYIQAFIFYSVCSAGSTRLNLEQHQSCVVLYCAAMTHVNRTRTCWCWLQTVFRIRSRLKHWGKMLEQGGAAPTFPPFPVNNWSSRLLVRETPGDKHSSDFGFKLKIERRFETKTRSSSPCLSRTTSDWQVCVTNVCVCVCAAAGGPAVTDTRD